MSFLSEFRQEHTYTTIEKTIRLYVGFNTTCPLVMNKVGAGARCQIIGLN